jgi:hypothetical protein
LHRRQVVEADAADFAPGQHLQQRQAAQRRNRRAQVFQFAIGQPGGGVAGWRDGDACQRADALHRRQEQRHAGAIGTGRLLCSGSGYSLS